MISNSNYFQRWHGCIALSALICLALLINSCGPSSTTSNEVDHSPTVIDTLPDDFVAFFNQFHDDPDYQMAHIIFPLEGLPSTSGDGDTLITDRYFYQKASWKKHNRFTDPGGDFDHWYEVLNDRIIEHWIQLKGTNLHMRRRFAKLDDGWYLIYYQELRPTDR